MGGGFGGADNYEVMKARSLRDAEEYAYEMACQEYEQYDGMHGLRSISDIMEEDGLSMEDAEQDWQYERESWLDYGAEEWTPEGDKKARDYHYHNPYE